MPCIPSATAVHVPTPDYFYAWQNLESLLASTWLDFEIECLPFSPMQNDITSNQPEYQVMALQYLPHLTPQYLVDMLERGKQAAQQAASAATYSRLSCVIQMTALMVLQLVI